MKNRGSIIASYIERDYRIKKAYEKKKRVNCIMKPCEKCEYEKICEDKDDTKNNTLCMVWKQREARDSKELY